MRIWITSDWHLNHKEIIEFENRKPDYHKEILRKITGVIKETDILIVLGDVILSNHSYLKHFLAQIHCKKILVRGNHDKKSFTWYMNNGFDFVCDQFALKDYYGKHIIFSHIPLKSIPATYINVHGHLHSAGHRSAKLTKRHYLYNPEKTGSNFMPVILQNLYRK